MLYNLGQIRSQIAQYCGVRNTVGAYDFDYTTFPTIDLANNMINDSFREICGEWDYTFLETTKSYPFYHTISGVQGVLLTITGTYSGNVVTGTQNVAPYPSDVLQYSWLAHNTVGDLQVNFSGVTGTFYNNGNTSQLVTGISTGGVVSYIGAWTGVGYMYQLDNDIDKLMVPAIYVPHSNNGNSAQGVMVKNIDYEDMIRVFPIGTIQASGTPIYFSEAPGLSNVADNGKMIQFGPAPTASAYSGNNFVLFYKKKHVDLVNDTDVQNVVPDIWQNAIIKMASAKVFAIADPTRMPTALAEASQLIRGMKLWDAKQPSKVRRWRDANYGTQSSFLFDNSSWFTLGGGSER
jgi:hypothetical protein